MEQKLGFGELVWKKAATWARRLGLEGTARGKVRAGVDMEEGTDEPGQRIKIRNGDVGTKHTEGTERRLVAVSVSSKIYSPQSSAQKNRHLQHLNKYLKLTGGFSSSETVGSTENLLLLSVTLLVQKIQNFHLTMNNCISILCVGYILLNIGGITHSEYTKRPLSLFQRSQLKFRDCHILCFTENCMGFNYYTLFFSASNIQMYLALE